VGLVVVPVTETVTPAQGSAGGSFLLQAKPISSSEKNINTSWSCFMAEILVVLKILSIE
jgi:hypothetical protein